MSNWAECEALSFSNCGEIGVKPTSRAYRGIESLSPAEFKKACAGAKNGDLPLDCVHWERHKGKRCGSPAEIAGPPAKCQHRALTPGNCSTAVGEGLTSATKEACIEDKGKTAAGAIVGCMTLSELEDKYRPTYSSCRDAGDAIEKGKYWEGHFPTTALAVTAPDYRKYCEDARNYSQHKLDCKTHRYSGRCTEAARVDAALEKCEDVLEAKKADCVSGNIFAQASSYAAPQICEPPALLASVAKTHQKDLIPRSTNAASWKRWRRKTRSLCGRFDGGATCADVSDKLGNKGYCKVDSAKCVQSSPLPQDTIDRYCISEGEKLLRTSSGKFSIAGGIGGRGALIDGQPEDMCDQIRLKLKGRKNAGDPADTDEEGRSICRAGPK